MRIVLTLFILLSTLIINAQVKVSGTVKNFNDSIFYITETGGFNNFTRVWRDNRIKTVVRSDKTFDVIIPEESIGSWHIKTANGTQIFDFVTGEPTDQAMCIVHF